MPGTLTWAVELVESSCRYFPDHIGMNVVAKLALVLLIIIARHTLATTILEFCGRRRDVLLLSPGGVFGTGGGREHRPGSVVLGLGMGSRVSPVHSLLTN